MSAIQMLLCLTYCCALVNSDPHHTPHQRSLTAFQRTARLSARSSPATCAPFLLPQPQPQPASSSPRVRMMPAADSARSSGMGLLLDVETKKSHSMAQNTAFVTGFFKGIAKKENFGELVTSLYFVYKAMEAAFDDCSDARVKSIDFPQLRRLQALEQDMLFYHGASWEQRISPSRGTAEYVARVEAVAAGDEPYLLVAHQYTRYLGDLFGGQMMSSMAEQSLKLTEGQGVAFYRFADIPDEKQFIETWYSELNKLELTEEQRRRVVEEANLVFDLNIRLFEELEGNAAQALWSLAISSLKKALQL